MVIPAGGPGWERPAAGNDRYVNDNTNAWFVGYTRNSMATVWIGNDKQTQPLIDEGGAASPVPGAQIWKFMRNALADKPITDFTPPAKLPLGWKSAPNRAFGQSYCKEIIPETFKTGTEPKETCPLHTTPDLPSITSLQICLDSDCCTEDCPRS